jgi:hypothetical protein
VTSLSELTIGELAAYIAEHLRSKGIETVLVGGTFTRAKAQPEVGASKRERKEIQVVKRIETDTRLVNFECKCMFFLSALCVLCAKLLL